MAAEANFNFIGGKMSAGAPAIFEHSDCQTGGITAEDIFVN
jgi:hypothetical protein